MNDGSSVPANLATQQAGRRERSCIQLQFAGKAVTFNKEVVESIASFCFDLRTLPHEAGELRAGLLCARMPMPSFSLSISFVCVGSQSARTYYAMLVQTVCRERLALEGLAMLLLGLSYDTLRIGRAGLLVDSVQSDRSASPLGSGGVVAGNGLRADGGENGSETAGTAGRLCCPCWITLSFGP